MQTVAASATQIGSQEVAQHAEYSAHTEVAHAEQPFTSGAPTSHGE